MNVPMTLLGKGSIGKEQLEQSLENTKLRETRRNKAEVSPFSSSLPLPSPPSFFLYFRHPRNWGLAGSPADVSLSGSESHQRKEPLWNRRQN